MPERNHSASVARTSARSRPIRLLTTALLAAVVLAAAPSHAQVKFGASASAKYEYNSNIFDLPTNFQYPGTTVIKRDDWYQAYGATFQVSDAIGRQQLYATVTGKDFRYGTYTYLDHVEYGGNAGLNWKLGTKLDGTIEIARSRTMVAFADLQQTQLSLLTEQRESATAGWLFMPDWRLQGTGLTHQENQPLATAPDLRLTESSGELQLQFVGRAGLVAGISGLYLKGSYVGGNGAQYPDYTQEVFNFVGTYSFSAKSSINGQAGYYRRTSTSDANNSSGPTAKIIYNNQITPKTSVYVGAERVINSYITNGGAEVDTSGLGGFTWNATYKLAVTAGLTYIRRNLPNQGIDGADRVDKTLIYNVKLDYNPLRWLWISPYANIQNRSSNFIGGAYNSNVYGIQFDVAWRCPTARCLANANQR